MSSLRQITGHRRIILAALLIVGLAAVFAATPPSQAQSMRCGTEFIYYSDSTYSCQVGLRGWLPLDCGCASYGWGSVTPYFDVDDAVC
jgi:hypothetical protein